MATIRRVPSAEHAFNLVITRVFEDGDQELLEDEDESESLLAIGELIASAIVSWKFTPSISQMVLHYLIHSYSIHS